MIGFRLQGFFLVLGFIATLGVVGSASAQPVINGSYYEETIVVNCNNASLCGPEFTSLSSRVLFSRVSCGVFNVVSTTAMIAIEIGVRDVANGTIRRQDVLPFSAPSINPTDNSKNYSLAGELDFLFASGKRPTVLAFFSDNSGANSTVRCKLTGRIQP